MDTEIIIKLSDVEIPVREKIGHAQAGLIAGEVKQDAKFATWGLVAAAEAKGQIDTVYARLQGGDLARFREYKSQVAALIDSYWKTFGLVFLQQTMIGGRSIVREVQPKVETTAPPAPVARKAAQSYNFKPGKPVKRYDPDTVELALMEIKEKVGQGKTLSAACTEVAESNHFPYNTVMGWWQRRNGNKL